MNKDVIDFKEFEYLGRSGAAAMQGRLPQAKRDAASQELTEKREEMRALYRSLRKAESAGISFPLGTQRLSKLLEEYRAAEGKLAEVGKDICLALDFWQKHWGYPG